jgi:hypothetical protein
MPDKAFEHAVHFHQVQTDAGTIVWLPLVSVTLIQQNGNRVSLSLLFDTGASVTTLRHDLYPLLGVPSWDSGQLQQILTAGGTDPVSAYRYQATLEFLGKLIECPIHLQVLPPNPLYVGLFGRELVFQEFGFGFWESAHDLYVTTNP